MKNTLNGKCECGEVSFTIDAPRETVTICHCKQCRRTSGHLWAATHASYSNVRFSKTKGLKWYASSEHVKRGFCNNCGSSLFYRKNDDENIAIAAGCLENPTGLRTERHIFIKDKGDYYLVADDARQLDSY